MRLRLFFLLVITMSILPIASSNYSAHAEALPEYCSDENGEITCIINIISYLDPGDYSPDVAEIPLGASVIFHNSPTDIHTATSTDATAEDSPSDATAMVNGIFDTGLLKAGEIAEPILMDESGVFHYYCVVHPDMHGTLIVGSGIGATGGEQSAIVETVSNVSLEFSAAASSDSSITGGELPITKIRSVGSEVYIIDGITPAGGHDAFSYDGSGHKEITGHVEVDLNPQNNVGKIIAEWTDPNGHKWKLEQTKFGGGNEMYIGETIDGVTQTTLDLDPVAINHFEHGTTGAGPTIEPTLFIYLASWGPAEVFKNGESIGTFETHMMVTDGARDVETGKIVKSDGVTPYSPMTPGDSSVNHNTAQLHLVYHTAPAPEMTNNFPPPFEIFEHVMFYDIDVLPNISAQTPSPVQQTDEAQGGGCLIATAAYGSELAPQVQFLREIRDNTVQSTTSGVTFMTGFNQLYYSFSPTIADWERENPVFKETVKAFITPMISTLSIMTLAEEGSEEQVLGLGVSVIALNLGMYVAAPTIAIWQIRKRI